MNNPPEDSPVIRLGKIQYLNCLPFYFGLEEILARKGLRTSYFESHPSAVNQAMRLREIDAAPVSSLEYLQHQEDYLLVPDLVIGARLFARSVLLVSRKKIEDLDHATIALSEESRSSAGLLQILLKKRFGLSASFECVKQDPERMLQKFPAALLIGDGALFCQPKDMIYKYDLAMLWREWTGKPFVFAVWAVRRDFVSRQGECARLLVEALRENLTNNLGDLEGMLQCALEIGPADKRFCQLLGYFANLDYTLEPDTQSGLVHFFELSHQEGLAPAPKPLDFLEVPAGNDLCQGRAV